MGGAYGYAQYDDNTVAAALCPAVGALVRPAYALDEIGWDTYNPA
jgi:hypothetical protein